MDFTIAIVLYIILLLMLLGLTWKMEIRVFSAVTISLLLAAIFLMILVPPTDLDRYTNDLIDGYDYRSDNDTAVAIICLIYVITLIVVIWYVLDNAYRDRNPCISL